MFFRAIACSLALLLSAQAFASGATVMVCRFTGQVLADCPCPTREEAPKLQRESCCELRGSIPFNVPAVVREQAQVPPQLDLALPVSLVQWTPVIVGNVERTPENAQAPPDQSALYLQLRQLLI